MYSHQLLKSLIQPRLTDLDQTQVRGEYKTCILNQSAAIFIHFDLLINDIPESYVHSIQRLLTRMMKKWLHLTPR